MKLLIAISLCMQFMVAVNQHEIRQFLLIRMGLYDIWLPILHVRTIIVMYFSKQQDIKWENQVDNRFTPKT
jgi:hypothetical protein